MSATFNDLVARAEHAYKAGNRHEAHALFGEILKQHPEHPAALRGSAWLADDAGDSLSAITFLQRLLAVAPNDARGHDDLGLCLIKLGQHAAGIAALRRATSLAPRYGPGFCNLGLALEDEGDLPGAVAALRRAGQLLPNSGFVAYHLCAVEQRLGRPTSVPPICPPDYLMQLFNGYADRFDRHLFQELQYQGPELLAKIVADAADPPPLPWDIMDLGCGTGMTAIPFRHLARRIVGIDLAHQMIRKAADRKSADGRPVYDELVETDVASALQQRRDSFDLALSADVFIYIGDLQPVFAACALALRPRGLFAFTIEQWEGTEDYRLLPTRRYAQSPAYVRRVAGETGLRELASFNAALRLGDDGKPLEGTVFLLQKVDDKPKIL